MKSICICAADRLDSQLDDLATGGPLGTLAGQAQAAHMRLPDGGLLPLWIIPNIRPPDLCRGPVDQVGLGFARERNEKRSASCAVLLRG
jgi:hypothetical protein